MKKRGKNNDLKKLCRVCQKPGDGHKHRKLFCRKCNKKTIHVIAFWGSPVGWICSEHKDITHCSKCGKKLSEETIKTAEALGALSVMCKVCSL
ncbi:MAG: hypothetical protein AAB564_00880 [Patescibacteria group bacterium]